jgi:hypothetical protein
MNTSKLQHIFAVAWHHGMHRNQVLGLSDDPIRKMIRWAEARWGKLETETFIKEYCKNPVRPKDLVSSNS